MDVCIGISLIFGHAFSLYRERGVLHFDSVKSIGFSFFGWFVCLFVCLHASLLLCSKKTARLKAVVFCSVTVLAFRLDQLFIVS